MGKPTAPWATDLASARPILPSAPDVEPRTFIDLLHDALSERPGHVQYVLADGTEVTVEQFFDLSARVAKALITLAVAPRDTVCIIGANALEWFAADVGAALAAVIPVGVYPTNKADVVAYIADHCAARVFFVDSEPALDKFLSVKDACPNVRAVVCWGPYDRPKYAEHGDFVVSWNDFLALGDGVTDEGVAERTVIPTPESVCKLIYTSGTTGPPKAVMLSHDNITYTVKLVERMIGPNPADRMVSYLPASHIASNMTDIACVLHGGVTVTFADADALKGSLVNTFRRARPTILTAVPRVYEKIMEKMLAVGAEAGLVKRTISAWAKGVGTAAADMRDRGEEGTPWGYTLANAVVFGNVKKALGLDECRIMINTAAPLQKDTFDYFRSLDFQIYDMYGMSEATGPLTFNYPAFKAGSSGKALHGVDVKLHNADETGEGELCFRGRNVFVGYMGDEEGTRSAIDDDGYIHSGDLGRVDELGFVTITGRAKELLVTAGGENVAPVLVESTLVSAMPAIARAFAIGDKKKFISAVVVPYMDEQGRLTGPAAAVNPFVSTGVEAETDSVWKRYVADGVAKANENAISHAASVKRFEILGKDFSVETGELTPTMKVKRKVVVERLAPVIARLYTS